MYRIDYHTHSNFSGDCLEKTEDMIVAAIKKGINSIAITDHIDFMYPNDKTPFEFEYDEYNDTVLNLKEKYRSEIDVRLGIEMGFQPIAKDKIISYMDNHCFDFVICSTHCVDNKELYGNDYYRGKTKDEAYLGYFEDVLNTIRAYSKFNVYGHIDYINRYGDYEDNSLDYYKYKDVIDTILRELIQSGRGIEINTSGLRYGLGYVHPKIEILRMYKALGGEIITTGSDSHRTGDVGYAFGEVYEMLKNEGFKYITTFKNMKPEFIKI